MSMRAHARRSILVEEAVIKKSGIGKLLKQQESGDSGYEAIELANSDSGQEDERPSYVIQEISPLA